MKIYKCTCPKWNKNGKNGVFHRDFLDCLPSRTRKRDCIIKDGIIRIISEKQIQEATKQILG